MQKDTFKSLSSAVRQLLRENDFCERNSDSVQKRLILTELSAKCDRTTTPEEIFEVEKLIIDNYQNGCDDALYRRCKPGLPF